MCVFFSNSKYLGKLKITINTKTGKIAYWRGNPILLDSSFRKDVEFERILAPYKIGVRIYETTPIGYTKVNNINIKNRIRRVTSSLRTGS